jgi:hypothetical protein
MSRFLIFPLIFTLSACDLMLKRGLNNEDNVPTSVILAYFLSTQIVTSDTDLNAQLSDFFGSGISATPDSTFAAWINPPKICDYSENFKVDVHPKRNLQLGKLKFSMGEQFIDIPASTSDNTWGFSGRLSAGDYQIEPQGVNGTANYQQNFKIVPTSSALKVRVGNLSNPAFTLPSPTIPATTAADFNLEVSRSSPILIEVPAVADADQVRVRIRDGSNRNMGDVSCYGSPGEVISIPPSLLATFRSGNEGILEVDHIDVSLLTDTSRVHESLILSVTRQMHGTLEFLTEDHQLEQMELGRLTITD